MSRPSSDPGAVIRARKSLACERPWRHEGNRLRQKQLRPDTGVVSILGSVVRHLEERRLPLDLGSAQQDRGFEPYGENTCQFDNGMRKTARESVLPVNFFFAGTPTQGLIKFSDPD